MLLPLAKEALRLAPEPEPEPIGEKPLTMLTTEATVKAPREWKNKAAPAPARARTVMLTPAAPPGLSPPAGGALLLPGAAGG